MDIFKSKQNTKTPADTPENKIHKMAEQEASQLAPKKGSQRIAHVSHTAWPEVDVQVAA